MPFVEIPEDDEGTEVQDHQGLIRIRPQAIARPTPIRIFFNGARSFAPAVGLMFLETPGGGLSWKKRSPGVDVKSEGRSRPYSHRLLHAIQTGQNPIRVPRPLPLPIHLHGEPSR